MNEPAPRIRPVEDTDRAGWQRAFEAYRDFYKLPADPNVVDTVWGWLTDAEHDVNGLVATRDGEIVGIAHYRRFARPSTGTVGLYLDDLFVAPGVRGSGTGRALLETLRGIARDEGLSVVRWITANDNETAQRLYNKAATKTGWITYDMSPEA